MLPRKMVKRGLSPYMRKKGDLIYTDQYYENPKTYEKLIELGYKEGKLSKAERIFRD